MNQPPVLPLTEQNLLNLSSNNNEMLERYCQELTKNRGRCQSTPPQIMQQQQQKNHDFVVASPRLLPFPYHNDSMFLPTAEQVQYQMSSCYENISSSNTSRADSSSSIPPSSPSFISQPQRPQSTTNIRDSSNYSISSISHHHHRERRSLPSRLDSLVVTNNFSKHRFLRRSSSCSSFGSSSVSSLEIVENDYAHTQFDNSKNNTKKPWLKRILKFFKNSNKQQHHDRNTVWYCQYTKNPSSRFEKYYNQKQLIIVS
jgi:hypothetical protein